MDRVEKFIEELDIKSLPEQSLLDLKKVQRDYDAGFNYKKIALHVCVARLIEMLNLFKKEQSKIGVQDLKQLLVNLYPFSATFAEEIWNQIQDKRGIPNGKRVLLSSSTLTSLGVGIQASGAASTFKILINSKPISETIPSSLIINGQIADKELKDFLSNHSNLPKAELVTRVIVNTEKSLINILAPQHKPSPKK